ncbi:MAG TPA: HAMP domain-containing sensor histidine kinase, partial [Thermoanaerobaculia bacterium]|nr:HAMP domain-containing sensor histidine kinase [Thermoanaerobaculia bacterium]
RRDSRAFFLATRWSDERCFREWHGSEAHRTSHQGIPGGLRLDPSFTEVRELARIDEPDGAAHQVADAALLFGPFLDQARGTLFLECAADGAILACNPQVAEVLGVPAPDLVGRFLWRHLTESGAALLRARIAAAVRRPEERIRLNVCDAADVPHSIECHLDLRPGGFVLVGERDYSGVDRLQSELLTLNQEFAVTARERTQALSRAQRVEQELERLLASERQARAEAEEANRRKDEILAMVSHDLRAPLGAIAGWAQVLAGGQLDAERVGRAVGAIQRNADLQARLIEDLLDVARIQAGKLRLDPRPIDPAEVVESILETEKPTAAAKGVTLERVIGNGGNGGNGSAGGRGAAALVLADPARLGQALGNLVANAVKFTPTGGRVEVRLEPDGEAVAIHVQDTGTGIDAALLPHIFDRFRQGRTAGTAQTSGLGLGLAIARDLIELQGGTLAAASDGPGRGATFTVKLPRHEAGPGSAQPETGPRRLTLTHARPK